MSSIVVRCVKKVFKLPNGQLTAIEDLNFEVGDHEFVSIIGPSGCGKSTVLRLIADILQPTEGDILIHGVSPSEARKKQLFSFVFQDPVMVPWRNVIKNVELPLEIIGRSERKKYADRPTKLLDLVGLHGFNKASPNQLSGGMKQRAAIARALLMDPVLLLMDEPFGALDEITRDRMNLELLRIWKETDAAVLFVTHSIDEAVFLSDRVIVLSPSPGTVYTDFMIDIPRPRSLDVKKSELAFEYGKKLRHALEESIPEAGINRTKSENNLKENDINNEKRQTDQNGVVK